MYCKANELFYFKGLNDNVMVGGIYFDDCTRMYLHDKTPGNFALIIQKDKGSFDIDYSIHNHHERYTVEFRDAVDCLQKMSDFVNKIHEIGLGAEF